MSKEVQFIEEQYHLKNCITRITQDVIPENKWHVRYQNKMLLRGLHKQQGDGANNAKTLH